MNKILLGSTALLGALVLAQPASAAEMTVKLGGYINFTGGFFDHDYQADGNDFDFDNEVEVHVRADGKADNGLLYGVKIELETGGAVQNGGSGRDFRTDEANIYVAGTWGRIELGDDDGASDQLAVAAPVAGAGFSDQGDRYGDPASLGDWLKVVDSSDSTKITYFTPSFSGFKAGISYAPETNEGDAVVLDEPTTGYSDWVEGGVQYKGEFSGVGVALSGTVSTAQGNGVRDDFTNWQLGANLSYAGFTLGGGYIDYDDVVVSFAGNTNGYLGAGVANHGWNIGASYANGPVSASVAYAAVEFDGFDYTSVAVDVGYTVAPGMVVGASYRPYNIEVDGGSDIDGHTILLGTKLSF